MPDFVLEVATLRKLRLNEGLTLGTVTLYGKRYFLLIELPDSAMATRQAVPQAFQAFAKAGSTREAFVHPAVVLSLSYTSEP